MVIIISYLVAVSDALYLMTSGAVCLSYFVQSNPIALTSFPLSWITVQQS
jgi:hypothetical protein